MKTIKLAVFALFACLLLSNKCTALERWAALSIFESGNNDRAIGTRGELSRYQILPALWTGGNPRNSAEALAVAQRIMKSRLAVFERTHKRPVTDFEFYILWNAPAQVDSPSKVVSERARRFSNLVQQWCVNQPAKVT